MRLRARAFFALLTLALIVPAVAATGVVPAGAVGAPHLDSISPPASYWEGSLPVTISGSNLTGTTAVMFGSSSATSVVVVDDSTITAQTPSATIGATTVTVISPGGTSNGIPFTFNNTEPAPAISSIAPATGRISGGDVVAINGTYVNSGTSVTFGGVAGTPFAGHGPNEIEITTPAHAAGAVDVVLTTGVGSATATNGFTYVPVPVVTSVSPVRGLAGGGTSVTITGTTFTGASAVRFGATAATGFTLNSATSITATSPAHAVGVIDVRVTTPGGTSATGASDQFTFGNAPTVTAVSPVVGVVAGGTSVAITGTNLTGATGVSFGATAATGFTVNSATSITATSPASAAGTVDVTVTTPYATSATGASDQFTFGNAPSVSAVSPAVGVIAGGTSVTISGANFTGATSVKFATTAATGITVVSATSITATSPAHAAGSVDVTVTTPFGTSATGAGDHFTFGNLPSVSAVSPGRGPVAGGTPVTIAGTNFTGATSVTFGTTAATGITVVSASSITATSPASAAGTVDVTVTTPFGTSATGAGDHFTFGNVPAVSAVSPSDGLVGGNDSVTITGTDLSGATAVMFGTTAATSFAVVSATSITATSPAHVAGSVDVTVTTPFGTSATGAPDGFEFGNVPAVSAVSPALGSAGGNETVTITGSDFTGATDVMFGTTAAASFTVVSATSITATSPAHAAGSVDVTVTTPFGTSATGAPDRFEFGNTPTVSAVSPARVLVGGTATVTITGSDLSGTTDVLFGATPAAGFTLVSSTSITATSPVHAAGSVDITVTTPFGASATGVADRFEFGTVPVVSAVSPSRGLVTGGISVTITGTGLAGASDVLFGATPAANFTVVSNTSIIATSPAHAVGATDVTVTTPFGTSTVATPDEFTFAVPDLPPPPPPTSSTCCRMVTSDGGVFAVGDAQRFGDLQGRHLGAPVVGLAATRSGNGYWLVASDGGVFAFGDARFHGSMSGRSAHAPIVAIAATPDGGGYWLAAADGGVFAFGDAHYAGSMAGRHLNAPVVGMTATPTGYLLVAADGGVFAFGEQFYGSMGAARLGAPIVGMTATAEGYLLVGSDGGVFAFGDASMYGSETGETKGRAIVGIVATEAGYLLATRDGVRYSFTGAARGVESATTVDGSVVGIA